MSQEPFHDGASRPAGRLRHACVRPAPRVVLAGGLLLAGWLLAMAFSAAHAHAAPTVSASSTTPERGHAVRGGVPDGAETPRVRGGVPGAGGVRGVVGRGGDAHVGGPARAVAGGVVRSLVGLTRVIAGVPAAGPVLRPAGDEGHVVPPRAAHAGGPVSTPRRTISTERPSVVDGGPGMAAPWVSAVHRDEGSGPDVSGPVGSRRSPPEHDPPGSGDGVAGGQHQLPLAGLTDGHTPGVPPLVGEATFAYRGSRPAGPPGDPAFSPD
ncbi:hypothetical protein [Thermomonospora umbrina]|uniref:Uncharacterized protein n=1 Tax=Thermomonospora umbrina TaxID=111806 RepID=A0A3D9SP18_9ACTN|nr:hypothetical protein [Thermomonospora umbrina]REE97716.1 hypothetical protein DFJ69_3190 [Thermomonospora umbrina]